jgi:hypothetical protein
MKKKTKKLTIIDKLKEEIAFQKKRGDDFKDDLAAMRSMRDNECKTTSIREGELSFVKDQLENMQNELRGAPTDGSAVRETLQRMIGRHEGVLITTVNYLNRNAPRHKVWK